MKYYREGETSHSSAAFCGAFNPGTGKPGAVLKSFPDGSESGRRGNVHSRGRALLRESARAVVARVICAPRIRIRYMHTTRASEMS